MNEQIKRISIFFSSVGGNCPAERKQFSAASKQRAFESTARLMILGPVVARRWEAKASQGPRTTTGLTKRSTTLHREQQQLRMMSGAPCRAVRLPLSTAASELTLTGSASPPLPLRPHFMWRILRPHAFMPC
ncbi:hypothetical protein BDA96_06G096200 [Sorghum bicolor]|uniref:Uncharacterized protein n=1 Tax=Sorghum bicolor TaxID=4558 RepID=A0A921QS31_SORBI|nr:hypothetical protein BDA96_06G096200 [Sorghum bicolor]